MRSLTIQCRHEAGSFGVIDRASEERSYADGMQLAVWVINLCFFFMQGFYGIDTSLVRLQVFLTPGDIQNCKPIPQSHH